MRLQRDDGEWNVASTMNLDTVQALYDSANGRSAYRKSRKDAEAHVAQWHWATGPLFGLSPFEPECYQFSRGRPLRVRPKVADGYEFGFDEASRLRVERLWSDGTGPTSETFFSWSGETVTHRAYDAGGVDLANVAVYRLVEGKPFEAWSVGARDTRIVQIEYVGGVVEVVRTKLGREPSERVYRIIRKGTDVVRIDYQRSGREAVAWTLPPKFKQEWFVRPGERVTSNDVTC